MSQYVVSVIRTWVPILVGSLIGWLVSLGLSVPEDAQSALTVLISATAIALYYAAVRWLETRYPNVGALLGYIRQPVYVDPKKTPDEQVGVGEAVNRLSKTPTDSY